MASNQSFTTQTHRAAITGGGPTPGSPLAPLYANPYDFSSLSYPRDLGMSNRGHWIQFYINVADNTQYATRDANGQILNYYGIRAAGANPIPVVNGAGRTAINQQQAANARALTTADAALTVRKTKRISQAIALYMPETVNVQYNADWQSESLTDALGKIGRYGALAEDLLNANKSLTGLSGALSEQAVKLLGSNVGGNATDFALFTQGLAINPQLEVLFKGTDMRHFQFDFLFSPYDAQESEHVVQIIKTLKFHQAPEVVTGSSGRFFVPPSEFDIDFIFQGEINGNIHQIGTCVLTNMNVDYAPNGWSTFSDGMPTQIRLTLQFMETEIVTKERVAKDNY